MMSTLFGPSMGSTGETNLGSIIKKLNQPAGGNGKMHLKFTATLLAAFGLSLVGNSFAAERTMSKECISPEAYKNLSECPSGAIKSEGHKRAGTSFKSQPPPPTIKKQKDVGPGDVST